MIALVAFVVWAKTVADPLVDLGLFGNRTYNAVNAATFTFGIAFAMMFFAFFYMSNVWHYSQARAGLAIAPGPLMVIPVASKLPAQPYAVGSAVNQATRQIGAVIGVAITVLLLGHGVVQRSDFNAVYGLHIALALMTAVLCAFVNTRPAPRRGRACAPRRPGPIDGSAPVRCRTHRVRRTPDGPA